MNQKSVDEGYTSHSGSFPESCCHIDPLFLRSKETSCYETVRSTTNCYWADHLTFEGGGVGWKILSVQ